MRIEDLDPGMPERLGARYDGERLRSRRVELASLEDDIEACYDRGWSDGLPVVPPTPERVLRMLEGTDRAPDEIVAVVPPDFIECTRREGGHQRRDGRLPARVPAGGAGAALGGLQRDVQHAWPAVHHHAPRAGDRGQRAHRRAIGMNSGRQRARSGQPGQLHHRPGVAARGPQRRRRQAGRDRPGDPWSAGQGRAVLRRGRGRLALGAALGVRVVSSRAARR